MTEPKPSPSEQALDGPSRRALAIEPPAGRDAPDVRIEVLSQPRFLAGVREMMAAIASRLGLDETGASKVALAVDEALCNVIRHGYDQRPDGRIEVSVWITGNAAQAASNCGSADNGRAGGGMLIRIDDEGKQTDPERIRSRDLTDIRPGGLGVHIINEVMDLVKYEKRKPIGMRLTMVKVVPDGAADAGADARTDKQSGNQRGEGPARGAR